MLVEKAYLELYPDAHLGTYEFHLKYSAKFNDYNGNVSRRGKTITFHLSRKWQTISDDIQIGLIQLLFSKLFKTKKRTTSMELYETFLKRVHIAVAKTKTDPILEASFNRVNDEYFFGTMEIPNLEWGVASMRQLGKYEYGSDTITMSTIFQDADSDLLDFVMYHELLHKKHKFTTKGSRSYHHTKEFLADEKKFKNFNDVNKRIEQLIRKKKGFLRFF